ncbi:hypothetical protein FSARC_6537 [Fusarium sarcochroum]|uniref:C2H2-type domain-containing protein n=1 Tax=Fusarium sarcochroum TaxID=1208366 RepID=A0A8H4TX89_9HYPO|nr:hypothetical protein FSARC_6537 [Fusarium sarcochroum]
MSHKTELGKIASHVSIVFESYRDLQSSLTASAGANSSLDFSDLDKFTPILENDLIRFKMWTGNQAAHQSGPASLDHRLREAPHLQQQVVYLLRDISKSLHDTVCLLLGKPLSWQQNQQDAEDQDDTASSGSLDHDDADDADDFPDDFSDFSDESPSPDTWLSTLFTDIGEAIDCLLRLSVAIANPAPHERFHKHGVGPSEDASYYEPHDIAYVRDKFPKITQELAEALGKSITRRRRFFKYREAHHIKLAAGLESMASNRETDTSRTEVPKTVASSLPEHWKNMTNFDPRANFIDEDGRSDTGMSQTSYATSAGFLTEDTNEQAQRPPPPLRVPPLPSSAEKGIFECPFCYRPISATTRTAWKRHVFGDLRPYTCIISHCAESNTDFDRRHSWQAHVSKYHWRSWYCPFKCNGSETFSSALELTQHVKIRHLPSATEKEVEAIVARGERAASNDTSNKCVICGHTVTGLKKYIKHVGRHLEQLALFALPNLEDENAQEDHESDEENVVASEINANSSQSSSRSLSPTLQPLEQENHFITKEEEDALLRVTAAETLARVQEEKKKKAIEELKKGVEKDTMAQYEESKRKAEQAPIQFKDAVGRRFSFPFHLVATWVGMEDLIKQAFEQVDILGPHVIEGHYDLIGPSGEIILPSVWERVIQPGWAITMTMWPMHEAEVEKLKKRATENRERIKAVEIARMEEEKRKAEPEAMSKTSGEARLKYEAEAKARVKAENDAREKFEAVAEAVEEQRKAESEARKQAEREARETYEAEMGAAAEQHKSEAKAEEEARLKLEVHLKAAEERGKKEAEERVRAEREARMKFEAELRARKKEVEEELARLRFENALQMEKEEKEATAKKLQEETERLMIAEQEAEEERARKHALAMAEAEEKARFKFEVEMEAEALIRKEAEEAFQRRMEDLRLAQEESKKEIERARIEAEKAARERMEAERKAEEQRARKHALAMAEAEEKARFKFEAELKVTESRGMNEAEEQDMKEAEELARVRFEKALQEEMEAKQAAAKQAQQEAERLLGAEQEAKAKAAEEARLKYEAELRAGEEVGMQTGSIPRSP